jgi:membrane protein involved in D-alanine export
MLPFSGFGFFVLSFVMLGLLHGFREHLSRLMSYPTLVALLTCSYVLLAVPRGHLLLVYALILFFLVHQYRERKLPLALVLVVLIFPLLVSKLRLSLPEDMAATLPALGVTGLSYFTFRGIQMMMDSRHQPVLSFRQTVSFLLFPPALLAGPIDRSHRFCGDLDRGYQQLTKQNLLTGLRLMAEGYVLKNLFAELVDSWWLARFPVSSDALSDMLGQAYGYTAFLYFDFAGYSLMAIGLALTMGINLPANFDKPWLAMNPKEFWQRFHITLGSFLNDYFFKPIYKNLAGRSFFRRHRLAAQNISLFLTFTLMGCWNGLTWYYVTSGMMFGLASVLHNSYARRLYEGLPGTAPDPLHLRLYRLAGWAVLFNYVVCALYLFSGRVPI